MREKITPETIERDAVAEISKSYRLCIDSLRANAEIAWHLRLYSSGVESYMLLMALYNAIATKAEPVKFQELLDDTREHLLKNQPFEVEDESGEETDVLPPEAQT